MAKHKILIRAKTPEAAQKKATELVVAHHNIGQVTTGYVQPFGNSPSRWLVIVSTREPEKEPTPA